MKVKITRKFEVAVDICAFELSAANGAALPAFRAGAHIDAHPRHDLVRQYSLCNPQETGGRYLIGVLREPASRGGSVAMHALQEGDEIEISAPKNHFPLAEDARHSILIAGGIGITPILSMAEQLARDGASFELHYCTREPQRTAFLDRLESPHLKPHTHLYHDTEPPEQRLDLTAVLAKPRAGTHIYVCGPGGLIDAVLDRARRNNWSETTLHREYFAASPTVTDNTQERAFQVKLASSGQLIAVPPGSNVVAMLSAAGIDIATSCGEGVCGTCLTRVLEGEPEHRDFYLTDEERAANDQFLPCCSRSKTAVLVLDL